MDWIHSLPALAKTWLLDGPSHAVMERMGTVRDVEADFDHPRVPDGSPLERHILHRITAEQWRKHYDPA